MKIKAIDILIEIDDAGTWKPYACATQATLDLATSSIAVTLPGDGYWQSYLPEINSFTGTLEGFASYAEGSTLSLMQLRAKQIAQTMFRMNFKRGSGATEYTESGIFFITDTSESFGFVGFDQFTVNIQGTGPLTQNGTTPPDTSYLYKYGFVSIDTTLPYFNDDARWAAIIAAIEVKNDATDYNTATAASDSAPITVPYSAVGYLVRFLIYPASVTPFLYWTEVGNYLQQHLLIAANTTWRADVLDTGEIVIATRYMTAFTNHIKFEKT